MIESIMLNVCYILIVSFLFHVLIWQLFLPKREQIFIVVNFTAIYIASFFIVDYSGFGVWEHIYGFLLYNSVVFSYVITYTAISEDSPSLTIVRKVFEKRKEGCHERDLNRVINDDLIVKDRILPLEKSGMIVLSKNCITLTSSGVKWAKLFRYLDKLMGTKEGG